MSRDFDLAKDSANRAKHGLSLDDFAGFDSPPRVVVDDRRDYGEARYRAFGRIGGQGHCLVYVLRDGRVRPISFRRAHDKELARHGL